MTRWVALAGATLVMLFAFGAPGRADSDDLQASIAATREPVFDGLGNLHHPVTTKNNSILSQKFFDQGLTFFYAFNLAESADSFRQAAQYDPDLAMAYWGIALALGPNINEPEDTEHGKMAYAAITKAKSLEAGASQPERDYIDALATRFSADGSMSDDQQRAYANAMREVARKNPDDPDAPVLFAEAMMDLHRWGLWTLDGQPVDGTPELVATLEGVLARYPNHIGANHYYIHAVEASPNPGRALESANRLPKVAPAAGHIVHMPAHIYFRTGDYDASANANLAAIKADKIYLRERNPKGVYPMMYVPHNISFLWASYMMEGNARGAFKASRELDEAVPLDTVRQMPAAEMFMPTRYFAEARFLRWRDVLKEPAPPSDLTFTTGIWHYARGLALAATGRLDDALTEKKKVDLVLAATPSDRLVGFNSANRLLAIASATLAGEIESANGHDDDAVNYYKEAVAIQDALAYDEPPTWYYPVRQTLGMELLAEGKTGDAEQVFRDDLKQYPENGWSLNGLAICLRARNATDEGADVDARLKKAWAHADVSLPSAPAPTAANAQ